MIFSNGSGTPTIVPDSFSGAQVQNFWEYFALSMLLQKCFKESIDSIEESRVVFVPFKTMGPDVCESCWSRPSVNNY